MPWFKVDDRFLRHPKTIAAADALGGVRALGRVAAVWLEAGLYASEYLTDGYVPAGAAEHFSTDPKAVDVLEACVRGVPPGFARGLFWSEAEGYRFHDWLDYQPSAETVREKRRRDRLRKSSARNRDGHDAESVRSHSRTPLGLRAESSACPRAPDPDPDPKIQIKSRRAPRAPLSLAAIRSHLRAAVHRQLDADPDTPDSELAAIAKDAAAALRVPYDGREVTKVVDAVRGVRARRQGRAA